MKKRLAGLLAVLMLLSLTAVPAMAEESQEPEMQPVPIWAYDTLADACALGLWDESYAATHTETITETGMDALTAVVREKTALLDVSEAGSWEESPFDSTRGGVLEELCRAAAGCFPQDMDSYDYLARLGVIQGDGGSLSLERPCTQMEAVVLSTRLVLALYDQQNAGSLGLLWKAEGNGNTLYLLGTAHVDRNNIYPFHKQLRDTIASAEEVIFELDFNDLEDAAAFAAMQMYSDGTGLKDHVSAEVYERTVTVGEMIGLPEEQINLFKPWALALSFEALSLQDETTGDSAMAVDLYINAAAVNRGIDIGAVESYVYQGALFDTLSAQYQEDYLASCLALILGETGEDADLSEEVDAQMTAIVETWKERDIAGFEEVYDKDAILNSDNELSVRLFEERDPNMVAAADGYLKDGTGHVRMLVVGAGHMVGETGVVQGLKDLGYTVETVPVP